MSRFGWLTASFVLAASPHLLRVPIWVGPTWILCLVWRYRMEARGAAPPPRAALTALAVAVLALTAATTPRLIHQDTFVTVLLALGGLKLLESQSDRDALVCLFLSSFLHFVTFLTDQQMGTAAYGLGGAVVITAAMNAVAAPADLARVALRLRFASRLAVQAAPLTLLLFLLFPRIAGRQWSLALSPAAARSGLSDRMDPGSVSRVALSAEVAFRVTFEPGTRALPPSARYWRGPVLEEGDGLSWRQAPGEGTGGATVPLPDRTAGVLGHWVTLEPHGRPWLLALDVPVHGPVFAARTRGGSLVARRPVRERLRYLVGSSTAPIGGDLDAEARARNLRPPPHPSDRVAALARDLRAGAPRDGAMVASLLAYFRRQPFVYTLEPPTLGTDPLDEFLFVTRRGFCEHYAAACASLLRLVGVPARVVTGYLGGEHNPLGDYWVVRQSDAHAWCEVWLPGVGWQRVDPTAAVAPERVELGVAAAGAEAPFGFPRGGALGSLAVELWRGWDALANGWNQWFLGYDELRQRLLLARLGYPRAAPLGMALLLAALSAAALGFLVLTLSLSPRRARDPAEAAYARFCATLAAVGLPRRPYEGPLAFAARVGRERSDLSDAARRVAELYAELRYGAGADGQETLAELRARVAKFSASPIPRAEETCYKGPR